MMTRSTGLLPLRLWFLALVCWFGAPVLVSAQTTALFLDSQPGDYIGQGAQHSYTAADGTFTVTRNYKNGVSLTVIGPSYSFWWYLDFSAPANAPLTVGTYESARRYPFTTGNGLSVSGNGSGCGELTGRYTIREIVVATDGSVLSFAADFEQHCSDLNPALFGAIRYNSSISDLEPFEGDYPLYKLNVTLPSNGRVSGDGIDCGTGPATCTTTVASPTLLRLTAIPDPGYAFVGWSGDCSGEITIWIRLNQQKQCAASFATGIQGTTALFVHSQPGEPLGNGVQTTVTHLDATFTPSRNYDNGVSVSIQSPDFLSGWNFDFSAAGNAPLAVGTYGAVRAFPWTPLNGMSISRNSTGCGGVTGRYVVREVVLRQDGSVMRFAVDLEAHCGDVGPGLFAALRYNSSIDDLNPFEGNYPVYQLAIQPPPSHGRVTGGGLDCGSLSAPCQISPTGATHVSITATPDVGYVFTGWTGDCRGSTTASVHVNGPKSCEAQFEPLVSSSPRTVLVWDSQPGDYIGAGNDAVYSPANSVWTVSSGNNRQQIFVGISDATDSWSLTFSAAQGRLLSPGYYSAARRYPFTTFNGLSVSGSGRGCNQLTGRFVILEIAVASDGTVERFAADFEQHCEDGVNALFGAIRYNSTVDEVQPFAGLYPLYQLTMALPAHGRVSASGLDCGGQSSQCVLTLGGPSTFALTAAPDFGYVFMGWSDDCSGGTNTTLHVNGPKTCSARFEPAAATGPRTILRWESQPGHYIGQGRSEVYSLTNSVWTVGSLQDGPGVEVRVDSVGPTSASSWTLWFLPPTGDVLQVGRTYFATTNSSLPTSTSAALFVFGNGRACSDGEFTVRDLVRSPANAVLRFAADFVLNCGTPTGPLLTGSIQSYSLIDVPRTTLTVDPLSLQFAAVHNGVSVTEEPAVQLLRISLSRADVGWRAIANQPWIQISPGAGTGSVTATVFANLFGNHPGTGSANGTITITLNDGTETQKTINLNLTLYLNGTTTVPFGVIDSPKEDSTGVTGAIPITGWVLDDIDVARVTICRAAVGNEIAPVDANCGGAAQIFVGYGVFIEGARPDVQAAYPLHPRNDVGGWGFMLLTNTLPNQGNGTFRFYVYARDREGHVTLLGTRTMTCDNAHATAPFGAIDTPWQGETISGSSYVNFGWALTQNPKFIPTDGSTLTVYVDGQPVGSPSYNHYRSDIATTFPGLANTNGAVGFKMIDTTTLTNGLHTIVWTAADSDGVMSGLGSRFFRVIKGGSAGITSAMDAGLSSVASPTAADLPLDTSPFVGRRGWNAEQHWSNYGVGTAGRAVIRGEEIDRIELALGPRAGETYLGYLRVGTALRRLPIGSLLDADTGVFTWSPGVGFIGTYDLVFVRSANGRPIARREVRVILQPKGSGHVGAQVVIDVPRHQQEVVQPFALGGWAVDLDALTGTGIDTLHVWAYPLTGGPPVFVGRAGYGGTRPDVAAVHGEAFRDSGFGLVVDGLARGNYDLAVFGWSAVSGGFVPAKVVRVTVR